MWNKVADKCLTNPFAGGIVFSLQKIAICDFEYLPEPKINTTKRLKRNLL